jgi:hypothetical protein
MMLQICGLTKRYDDDAGPRHVALYVHAVRREREID